MLSIRDPSELLGEYCSELARKLDMPVRFGTLVAEALTCVAVVGSALTGCGGKSKQYVGSMSSGGHVSAAGMPGNGTGGSVSHGTGGSVGNGTGGSVGNSEGCVYNGIQYEPGDTFGQCGECSCDEGGGVSCALVDCGTGAEGDTGAGGGATRGGSSGMPANGGSAPCTTRGCAGGSPPTGMGGTGVGGMGRAGNGMGGIAGNPNGWELCATELGKICIEGEPTDGGHELKVGMPLMFTITPQGCYSSTCYDATRSSCQIIGSGQSFFVGGFACVQRNGQACDDICADGPESKCDTGETLTAGDYSIAASGTSSGTMSVLEFTVPGFISEADRCTHSLL